ncbi:YqaJ viral recombinase family protein [Marinobacterium litorale]|uniref:YqaJ viral recombinase family protein n=1 Tax=Marinobacterium litorale TaxID=404770 RepID=UPI0004194574|nr:YqaJ viral recombinase family protein [Marinobacterium litorale]
MKQGKVINIVQGSEEWAALRAQRFTASEAPAMAGKSKYQTRSALLELKHSGVAPEVTPAQQAIFNRGHAAEAEARKIAELLIGEELYPCVLDDAEGGYLASMDGLTMLGDIGWEHKLINQSLIEQIDAGHLEEYYRIQLDQQFALSGCEKILFTASDGTEDNCKHLWVMRDEARFKALEAGWDQFAADLANYTPTEAKPEAIGKNIEDLPSLRIDLTGEVRASNLPEFKQYALAMIESINTDLQTDQDFADAEKAIKALDKGERQLEATKKAALEQTASIDELFKTVDHLKAEMRDKRLSLNKLVKAEKENRRLQIINQVKADFDQWLFEQNAPIPVQTGFDPAIAMKGKKTISSLQSAADDELARAKVEAKQLIDMFKANKAALDEQTEYLFLFSDWQQLIQKQPDDLEAIIKARIAEHKEAEQKRLDAERERIRLDEERKAKAEAERKVREEQKEEPASEPGQLPEAAEAPADEVTREPVARPSVCREEVDISCWLFDHASITQAQAKFIANAIVTGEVPHVNARITKAA